MDETEKRKKTALVLGATGLTGGELLLLLLADDSYAKVTILVRRAVSIKHPKLEVVVCSLLELEKVQSYFQVDAIFCCIGTTRKQTPDLEQYYAIDHGIPVQAARLGKQHGAQRIAVVSAIGANAKSTIFYTRTKGEMERDVLAAGILHTYILRPSFITGNRGESRLGERVGIAVFNLINPLLMGGMKKYRTISATTIAKALLRLANDRPASGVIESDAVQAWGTL